MTRKQLPVRDWVRHGLVQGANLVRLSDGNLIVVLAAGRVAPADPLGAEFAVIRPRRPKAAGLDE